MNRKIVCLLCLLLAPGPSLSLAQSLKDDTVPRGAQKMLQRTIDPIVIRGDRVPALLGTPIEKIRVVGFRNDEIYPVPFQIDERDTKGSYIFRTGNSQAKDADNGLFDDNDELVFMCKDMGDRTREDQTKASGLLAEVMANDPVDKGTGWCYVTTTDRHPDLSDADYVSYDPQKDTITAINYHLGFSKRAPNSYADTAVTPAGGGNGIRVNDRVIIRLDAAVFGVLHIRRSEEDFRSVRKGYIDGPVRVIKRVGNSVRQVFGIYGPEIEVDYTFYYSNWVMPSVIDIPVDVGKYLSEFDFRGGTHWTEASKGMVFYTKYIAPGVAIIDGHMSEAEKKMDLRLDIGHIWHCYTGALQGTGQGSILFRILMDEFLRKTLSVKTYYNDRCNDPDFEDDPITKNEYKRYFEGSYVWMGMEKLPKGRYNITSWSTIMPDYGKPGDEKRYLDILDKPLGIKIEDVSERRKLP